MALLKVIKLGALTPFNNKYNKVSASDVKPLRLQNLFFLSTPNIHRLRFYEVLEGLVSEIAEVLVVVGEE